MDHRHNNSRRRDPTPIHHHHHQHQQQQSQQSQQQQQQSNQGTNGRELSVIKQEGLQNHPHNHSHSHHTLNGREGQQHTTDHHQLPSLNVRRPSCSGPSVPIEIDTTLPKTAPSTTTPIPTGGIDSHTDVPPCIVSSILGSSVYPSSSSSSPSPSSSPLSSSASSPCPSPPPSHHSNKRSYREVSGEDQSIRKRLKSEETIFEEMNLDSSSNPTTNPPQPPSPREATAPSAPATAAVTTKPSDVTTKPSSSFDKISIEKKVSPTPKLRARALSEPSPPSLAKARHIESNFKHSSSSSSKKSSGNHRSKRSSSDRPPVNLQTLRELDLKEIFNNPRLRHDIYFDSALHFRPNLDGQRGEKKRHQAETYWTSILKECDVLRRNQQYMPRGSSSRSPPKKLIILFETMRDIVLSLVPTRDQKMVEQVFDQTLIMQQLEHGLLDFKSLAEWLAGLLKAHCAPMRDSWVDDMVSKVTDGVNTGNSNLLVDGLKAIFGILEAMKLDVANHQIRTLRPFLVNSAADFEREHFYKRVDKGEVRVKEPQEWFQSVVEKYTKQAAASDFLGCLTNGVMDILTPSNTSMSWKKLLATFTYDIERLETIKMDIREDTCTKVCLLLFRQLVLSSKCRRDIDDATISNLTNAIQAILGDEEVSDRWLKNSSSIALQIAQSAAVFANSGSSKGVLPEAGIVKTAENWLAAHLRLDSKIYKMVEGQIVSSINERTQVILKAWSVHKSPSLANMPQSVMGFTTDFSAIPQRLAKILNLHWRVFDKIYLSSAQLKQLQNQQQKQAASSSASSSSTSASSGGASGSGNNSSGNEAEGRRSSTSLHNLEKEHKRNSVQNDVSFQHVERKEFAS